MDSLVRDFSAAARALRRKPGITALAVVSLAVAIAFSTAGFSVLDATMLRNAPVRDPATLAELYVMTAEQRPDQLTWTEYQALAAQAHSFQDIIAEDRQGPPVRLPDRDDFPITAEVSDNYFDVLGVRAALGEVFHRGTGRDQTLVITDQYWKQALNGDPAVIGRTLPVGPAQLRIIGILPPGFRGKDRGLAVDLFAPVQTAAGALQSVRFSDMRRTDFELLARLRPHVTLNQARTEADAILRGLERDGREPGRARRAGLQEFQQKPAGRLVFLAILVLLIVIAAANIANLRLVENENRRQETGIRLALGAGPAQLARTHLAEALLFTAAGTAIGIPIALWLIRLASVLLSAGFSERDYGVRVDLRTLAFSALALVLLALISSLIPLREAWKSRVLPLQSTRMTRPSHWLGWLVIAQMSVVTGAACSAALLWRSLQNVSAIRPAMDPDRQLLLVEGYWPDPQTAAGTGALASRLAALPDVESVAWARRALLSGSGGGAAISVEIPGQPPFFTRYNQVSPTYFATTGARILAGRGVSQSDGAGSALVVMVNTSFVRHILPGREPLGSWVKIGGKDRQIVGVVEDGPTIHLKEPPAPYLYFPFAQFPAGGITFFVNTARDPGRVADSARAVLRSSDRAFTIVEMTTLRQHMREARSEELLAADLAGTLALVGLLLATAGLFGVTQFAVARRTPEFGVRLALGARGSNLLAQVLRGAAKQVLIAIPLGWVLAYLARHALEHLLYGIAPEDASTFIVASASVAAIGCAAALYPASRAARIDPMAALRHQ